MNIKPNILIFSVFQNGLAGHANAMNHKKLLRDIHLLTGRNLSIKELKGHYNGVDELSILIEGFEHRDLVERICREYKQECYLESHNDRATFLVYPNGTKTYIGMLTPVEQDEAIKSGSWSQDPTTKQYFICK